MITVFDFKKYETIFDVIVMVALELFVFLYINSSEVFLFAFALPLFGFICGAVFELFEKQANDQRTVELLRIKWRPWVLLPLLAVRILLIGYAIYVVTNDQYENLNYPVFAISAFLGVDVMEFFGHKIKTRFKGSAR
jgi:hypothetical protein